MGLKEDKDNTTKGTKVPILRWSTREMLKQSDSMKSSGWLNVHKVNNSRDSFSSELRRNRGGKQQGSSGLKKVTMLTISNTILSLSTGARVLKKSALLRKKLMMRMR
jgi:hypothetical protein